MKSIPVALLLTLNKMTNLLQSVYFFTLSIFLFDEE